MDAQAITRLRGVEIDIGAEGVAVPLAIIDPVNIGGQTATRATFPDAAFLRDRDVRIGDAIAIHAEGGGLTITDALPLLRIGTEQAVRVPSVCPICACDLRQRGRDLVCANAACPPQIITRITQMASPDGFDIAPLDSSTVKTLVTLSIITTPADVFKLRERTLVRAGLALEQAAALADAVEASKNVTLARLLVAMTGISRPAAESVASHARSLARVKRLVAGSVARLPGLSIDMAEALVNFMREPRNRKTLAQMARAGVVTARVSAS